MSEQLKATSIDSNIDTSTDSKEQNLAVDHAEATRGPDKQQRSSEWLSKIPLSRNIMENENLSRLVYLEKNSAFFSYTGIIKSKKDRLLPLRKLQRATGEISGQVLSYDPETNLGQLLVGKRLYDYCCEVASIRSQMPELVGKEACFRFWPTANTTIERRKFLKLSKVIDSLSKENGYVEVVGKLMKIWKGSFRVRLCSEIERKFFYIFFSDDYPYPDEEGEWVSIVGHMDLNSRQLKLDEASALAFADENEASKLMEIFNNRQLKNKRKRQRWLENKAKASATNLTDPSNPSDPNNSNTPSDVTAPTLLKQSS
ncbi:MAG: hypothetical protein WAQ98_10490 [Blastocatellia bacterium]